MIKGLFYMEENEVRAIKLQSGDIIRLSPDSFENCTSMTYEKNKKELTVGSSITLSLVDNKISFIILNVEKNKRWWEFWKKLEILFYDVECII